MFFNGTCIYLQFCKRDNLFKIISNPILSPYVELGTKFWLSMAAIEFKKNILFNLLLSERYCSVCILSLALECIFFVPLSVVWLWHQCPTDYWGWFNWFGWLGWGLYTSLTTLKAVHWRRMMTSLGRPDHLIFLKMEMMFSLLACLDSTCD